MGRCQRGENCFENAFDLLINLAIRETQDFIASISKGLVSGSVPLAMTVEAMLMPVHFNDHPRATAFEVDDVGRKRRLPAKVMA